MPSFRIFPQLPQQFEFMEVSLYVLRFLGALTFVAYPASLIASIMGLAAPGGGTKSLHWLSIAGLTYPLVILALWWIAEKLRPISPLLTLGLTALPVVVIYGLIAWSFGGDYLKQRAKATRAEENRKEIVAALGAGNYDAAFDVIRNPKRSAEYYHLDNDSRVGFDFHDLILEAKMRPPLSEKFVRYLLDYVFISITSTYLHINHAKPSLGKGYTLVTPKLIALLARWKEEGVLPALALPHQWFIDNIDLFTNPEELSAGKFLKTHNPLLDDLLDNFSKTMDEVYQVIDKHPVDLINKRIDRFGTPLNAILLNESFRPSPRHGRFVKALLARGAELHESENSVSNRELLLKLAKEEERK